MKRNDGNPAYPSGTNQSPPFNGMSLRDRFAVELAGSMVDIDFRKRAGLSIHSKKDFAELVYKLADELVKARDRLQ